MKCDAKPSEGTRLEQVIGEKKLAARRCRCVPMTPAAQTLRRSSPTFTCQRMGRGTVRPGTMQRGIEQGV